MKTNQASKINQPSKKGISIMAKSPKKVEVPVEVKSAKRKVVVDTSTSLMKLSLKYAASRTARQKAICDAHKRSKSQFNL